MKRLLLAGLLLACTPSGPEAPSAVQHSRDPILASLPGDTLAYTLSWTAGARATGYLVTTTASGTGWSGMLTAAPTTALSIPFKPVNTAGWTTVDFTACVTSTAGTKTSTARCTGWTLVRSPGQPGPVTVDSSLIIAGFLQFPHTAATTTDVAVRLCPYFIALDGKARLVDGYNGAYCRQMYLDSVPGAMQLPGFPVQMEVATTTHGWGGLYLTVRSPMEQLAHDLYGAAPRPVRDATAMLTVAQR